MTEQDNADPVEFEVSERGRVLIKEARDALAGPIEQQFFDLWESEGCPRKAGSAMAHIYLGFAAQMAAFGALCDGRDPNPDLWKSTSALAFQREVDRLKQGFSAALKTAEPTP